MDNSGNCFLFVFCEKMKTEIEKLNGIFDFLFGDLFYSDEKVSEKEKTKRMLLLVAGAIVIAYLWTRE